MTTFCFFETVIEEVHNVLIIPVIVSKEHRLSEYRLSQFLLLNDQLVFNSSVSEFSDSFLLCPGTFLKVKKILYVFISHLEPTTIVKLLKTCTTNIVKDILICQSSVVFYFIL